VTWEAYVEIIEGFTASEPRSLFHDTAASAYKTRRRSRRTGTHAETAHHLYKRLNRGLDHHKHVLDVLEGTRSAFENRGGKYHA
jgi:hypothetical protein